MTISEAITKAVEGGWTDDYFKALEKLQEYVPKSAEEICNRCAFLNPQFWKCLGKAMGWKKRCSCCGGIERDKMRQCECDYTHYDQEEYSYYWHELIDRLDDGGTPESFFKELK